MKAYYNQEDYSYIIMNDNDKYLRVNNHIVETSPLSKYVDLDGAKLVHETDSLDQYDIGQIVCPDDVAREGVMIRLIGTAATLIYCKNQWRWGDGSFVSFDVDKAELVSRHNRALLNIITKQLER